MAYYNYKRVRDLLIECGWLDKYGNAVRDSDKREYKGEHDYDCHLWTMAAERIEQLEQEIASLKQQINSAKAEGIREMMRQRERDKMSPFSKNGMIFCTTALEKWCYEYANKLDNKEK